MRGQGKQAPGQLHAQVMQGRGLLRIAGVDEVGRGPLAGPVMAAAAVVPDDAAGVRALQDVVRDSKMLDARQRTHAAQLIEAHCMVGFGMVNVTEIDRLNIRRAALLAMKMAVENLPEPVDAVLVDGRDTIPGIALPQQALVKGDAVELAIACASIVAKVRRDALMVALAESYPGYGWETNVGYGAAKHLAGLESLGVTPHHRRTFAPVRARLEQDKAM